MKNPRNIIVEYSANLRTLSTKSNIRIWLAQPLSSDSQKIRSFSIEPKSTSSYKDKQGNKILYFEFKNTHEVVLRMSIELKLWQYQVDWKKIKISKPGKKMTSMYLKSEKFLEQTTDIKKIANSIIKDNKSELGRIKAAFIYTVENFNYKYPVVNRGVKNLDFGKLQGDCGEYSSFFVALCRALNIPARNSTGFVIYSDENKIMEHSWANVYTQSHGWLDFDTQYAALEKDNNIGLKKYFATRSDYRVAFIHGFNILIKPRIPNNYHFDYWNKLGLPLTHSSAQVLQPLIYMSDSKVRLKEKYLVK